MQGINNGKIMSNRHWSREELKTKIKMNKKLTQVEDKTVKILQNLVWFRITKNEKYLEAIPNIDSGNFHDWIYYMKYEFLGHDDSMIQAVVYLNGQHYTYLQTPQFLNSIWVDEIDETEVKQKIIELGDEICDGFELYNAEIPESGNPVHDKNELGEGEYYDLPF